jgi:hypothetical protein
MKTCLRLLLAILLPFSGAPAWAVDDALKDVLSARERSLIPLGDTALQEKYRNEMNAVPTTTLTTEWRTAIKALAQTVAAASPTDDPAKEGHERVGAPLSTYLLSRIGFQVPFGSPQADQVAAIWTAAETADAPGQATFYNNIRALIRHDAEEYHKGADTPEKFVAWLTQAMAAPGDANALAETTLNPTPPAVVGPLARKVNEIFTDPVERAIGLHIARKIGEEDFLRLSGEGDAAVFKEKLSGIIHEAIREKIVTGGQMQTAELQDLATTLSEMAVTDASILGYYCPKHVPVQAPETAPAEADRPVFGRLKTVSVQNIMAAVAESGEAAAEGADLTVAYQGYNDRIAAACARNANPRRPDPSLYTQPENVGTGTTTEPPAPGGQFAASADSEPDAEAEEESATPWKKMAVGAAGGAIGFGIIGFLLGGPIGALVLGAIGAAFMGGVTWYINQ